MSSTVALYISLIVIGLRWETLPQDVAFLQDVLRSVKNFGTSVFKQLCKKRMSEFTDNTVFYPRPPRTMDFPPLNPDVCEENEPPVYSNEVHDSDSDDSIKNETIQKNELQDVVNLVEKTCACEKTDEKCICTNKSSEHEEIEDCDCMNCEEEDKNVKTLRRSISVDAGY